MVMFDQIYFRVVELSSAINALLNVNPRIIINFGSVGSDPYGACMIISKKSAMYITLNFPENFKWDKNNRVFVDMMLCHEYCHYIEDSLLFAKDREQSINNYLESAQLRAQDERKTWRRTKELAIQLGLWHKPFYNIVKKCMHASDIRY